jgi:hypothetical protein
MNRLQGVGGADGCAMKFGCNIASTRATEEGIGKQWFLTPLSVPLAWVNGPMTDAEAQQIRQSVNRGAPFGSATWTTVTASLLGLDASLRPIGRPQKLVET